MYNYETERPKLFTEAGLVMFTRIRDWVKFALAATGAFRMQEALGAGTGDSWTLLACVDLLVERGEIAEVTKGTGVAGQHRVFVARAHP